MRHIALFALVTLTAVACSRSPAPETSTTNSTSTTIAPTSTTLASTTTTTSVDKADRIFVDSYDIMKRVAISNGDSLYVVIPPADYDDIGLETFVREMIADSDDLVELHVFDDLDAYAAFEDGTDGQLVTDHYLLRLTEGNVVEFLGPYSSLGTTVLGS